MLFAAAWMNLEIIILSKSDREKQISWYYSDVESNFKNDINELIYKTKADSQFL